MRPPRCVAGVVALGWLCRAAAMAQSALPANDVWKNAGAGDGLRQAFERAMYALKDSGDGTWRGRNRAQRLALEFDSSASST